MNGDFLHEIISHKKKVLIEGKKRCAIDELRDQIDNSPPIRDIKSAITSPSTPIKIIAEVKKASPSKGIIREDFDPVEIAKICEANGASAISVLTEEKFFHGSPDYLKKIREVTAIPLLCKDFIFDEYQIYQARVFGADAFLLIAAILDNCELNVLLKTGRGLGMQALVEVHNLEELKMVLQTEAEIIGINNRDLKTFKTDISTTERLIKEIPQDKIVVSESGINTAEDISRLRECGAHAFLIGESLMRERDIAKKLTELLSFQ
ncbi:MAG: indole-3-glycerol phosphate synthase TrpC [Desulfobacterales bacterium]|nr:indole-3-glycerol phosphate synthase TrpC [Desulfobacterales bacterium]